MLRVARAAYDAWARRGVSVRAIADAALAPQVAAVHARRRRTYGSPRIHAELRAGGVRCARKRVARLTRTTVAEPTHTPAPNLVVRDFRATAPDRLWIGASTSIATAEGWLYLAVLGDVHSRRMVGWALADQLRPELALDALAMARHARRPSPGLVHHTDRG